MQFTPECVYLHRNTGWVYLVCMQWKSSSCCDWSDLIPLLVWGCL